MSFVYLKFFLMIVYLWMFVGIEGDVFGWWNVKCMMYFDVRGNKILLVLIRLRSV